MDKAAKTITLPDGYNGHTVRLNVEPVKRAEGMVMLSVYGAEWLIKWVPLDVYERSIAA